MLSIPPIYENLSLRDYDAGMDDLFARVWLNPSLDIVRKRGEMVRRTLDVIKSTDMEADDKLRALDELRPPAPRMAGRRFGARPRRGAALEARPERGQRQL